MENNLIAHNAYCLILAALLIATESFL